MIKQITIAAAILGTTASFAAAHDTAPIDRAQERQRESIIDGRRSGELTRREARELWLEQRRISELERAAKSDGVVTAREFRALREAQRDAGHHIQQETHDGQRSWWRKWGYR